MTERTPIEGLEWILAGDKFGFGENWTVDSEPQCEEEQAGYYIQRSIDALKKQELDIMVLKTAYKELAEKGEIIVRCKECKWWDKEDDSNYGYCHACKHGYYSDHWEIRIYRTYKGDWFCADGERKD